MSALGAAVTEPEPSVLPALSARATAAHRPREGLQSAIKAGEALREAKAQLRHGEWLPWLAEAGIPRRTASRYMKLAERPR